MPRKCFLFTYSASREWDGVELRNVSYVFVSVLADPSNRFKKSTIITKSVLYSFYAKTDKLRSVWASAQTDLSFLFLLRSEKGLMRVLECVGRVYAVRTRRKVLFMFLSPFLGLFNRFYE